MDRDTVILEVHFFETIKQKKRVFSLENTLFFYKIFVIAFVCLPWHSCFYFS